MNSKYLLLFVFFSLTSWAADKQVSTPTESLYALELVTNFGFAEVYAPQTEVAPITLDFDGQYRFAENWSVYAAISPKQVHWRSKEIQDTVGFYQTQLKLSELELGLHWRFATSDYFEQWFFSAGLGYVHDWAEFIVKERFDTYPKGEVSRKDQLHGLSVQLLSSLRLHKRIYMGFYLKHIERQNLFAGAAHSLSFDGMNFGLSLGYRL